MTALQAKYTNVKVKHCWRTPAGSLYLYGLPFPEWGRWPLTAAWTQVWCFVDPCNAGTLFQAAYTETPHLQSGQGRSKWNYTKVMSFIRKSCSPLCTCCSSRVLSSSMSRPLSLSSATRCSHSCCSRLLLSCSSLSNRSRSARSSFWARSCSARSSLCSLWA